MPTTTQIQRAKQAIDTFLMRASLFGSEPAHIGEPGIAVTVTSYEPRPGDPHALVVYADMGPDLNPGSNSKNAASIVRRAVLARLHRLAPAIAESQLQWVDVGPHGGVDQVYFSPAGAEVLWRPLCGRFGALPGTIEALQSIPGGLAAWDSTCALLHRALRCQGLTTLPYAVAQANQGAGRTTGHHFQHHR